MLKDRFRQKTKRLCGHQSIKHSSQNKIKLRLNMNNIRQKVNQTKDNQLSLPHVTNN